LNGRLSLSDAEAIGLLLEAKSEEQIALAGKDSRDKLSEKIGAIAKKMTELLGSVYARIDYPDEDLGDYTDSEMLAMLVEIGRELDSLIATYKTGHSIAEGIKTAIVGKPNVGKSSLLNCMAKTDRAIVTDIAGTTRDVIEHTVSVGDVTLRLSDTAGIRDTQDAVEKIGVERARARLDESELVLAVFDASVLENSEDHEILDTVSQKSAIAIINKSDSERKMSAEFEKKIRKAVPRVVYMSAKSGEGLDSLASELGQMYALDEIDISNDAVITNARQASALSRALDKVSEASELLKIGESPDIICFSLEQGLASLDEIDARGVSEEIVNTIFSRFCVGK
jgi:tRNA modification GTPase